MSKRTLPQLTGLFLYPLLLITLFAGCGEGLGQSQDYNYQTGTPGYIIIDGSSSRPIQPTAYGQNYWDWVPSWTGQIDKTKKIVANLKLNTYRAGGNTNDWDNAPDNWDYEEIDTYIAYCRVIGAEPILQVPIISSKRDPNVAVDWVKYCKDKGYNVKYWIIGNEPDLYTSHNFFKREYTVYDYCEDFNKYASKMRELDPSIKIIGPEVCQYEGYNDWIPTFVELCRINVDIVSYHFYPYGKVKDFTITNILNSPKTTRDLMKWVKNNAGGKQVALTETHVSWSEVMNKQASAESFYAGLWIAEVMGSALEEDLWTVNFWGTIGGYGTGFIDSDLKPRPSYYGLWMFTNHFGANLITVNNSPDGLAVYASRNQANNRTIIIGVNKTNTHLPETIQIKGLAANVPERHHTFHAYSITCLSIPDDGGPMECWTYTKPLADQKQPPSYQLIEPPLVEPPTEGTP